MAEMVLLLPECVGWEFSGSVDFGGSVAVGVGSVDRGASDALSSQPLSSGSRAGPLE